MKRFFCSMLILLMLVSGVALAKKPLALVQSFKTMDKPVNYPNYPSDFEYLKNWLSEFATFDIITDLDVEDGALKNYEAAILPDNAVMGEDEIDAYFDFVDRGGKLFACFSASLRKEDGSLTSFQLADLFGVTWERWTNEKDKHKYILFESHKIFKDLPKDGIDNISSSTQLVTLNQGEELATWTNADKYTPSQADEKNACIIENEGCIYVTFPISTPLYLGDPNFGKLFINIVEYLSPNAMK